MENKREIYGKMLEIRNRIDAIKALDSNYLENEEYKECLKVFKELEEELKNFTIIKENKQKQEEKLEVYEKDEEKNIWNKIKKIFKSVIKNMSKTNKEN